MPTYRIYYSEREITEQEAQSITGGVLGSAGGALPPLAVDSTEWEETYDAPDERQAIDAFFLDHGLQRGSIRILEEDGGARAVEDGENWDPDRTYIWMEDEKLMEYQGLDESTPGMVACPLCDGTGEVEDAVAEEYEAGREG
jgi:hypothetical protein